MSYYLLDSDRSSGVTSLAELAPSQLTSQTMLGGNFSINFADGLSFDHQVDLSQKLHAPELNRYELSEDGAKFYVYFQDPNNAPSADRSYYASLYDYNRKESYIQVAKASPLVVEIDPPINSHNYNLSLSVGAANVVYADLPLMARQHDLASFQLILNRSDGLGDDGLEPNNTPSLASPIALNSSYDLNLSSNDIDQLSFTLNEAHPIQIKLSSNPQDNGLALRAKLFDANGFALAEQLASQGQQNLEFYQMLAAGSYRLAISALEDENYSGLHPSQGYYQLSLKEASTPPLRFNPSELKVNIAEGNTLNLNLKLQNLSQQPQTYHLSDQGEAPYDAVSLNPTQGTIVAESEAEIALSIDARQLIAEANYAWQIVLNQGEASEASFALNFQVILADDAFEDNNRAALAKVLAEGTYSLNLGYRDIDWFYIDLAQRAYLQLDLLSDGLNEGFGRDLDARMGLFDENLTLVAELDNWPRGVDGGLEPLLSPLATT
ncbi:MAG: hypothetical protein R2865_02115 [Deinococcales bacterium]